MADQHLGGTIDIGDLSVARMGFGVMRFSGAGAFGEVADRDNAIRILRTARDLGITLFDTAWAYGPELNETLLADALHPFNDVVVATKTGLENDGNGNLYPNGRPDRIKEMTEGSLKRLGVETIDLLQLHAPDSKIPLEDSVGAIAELQQEGKVRNIGLSNVSVDQLRLAERVAPIVSVQNHYNITHTEEHEAVLRACTTQDIAFMAYRPIANAVKLSSGAIIDVAARHNVSPSQVALAWLLQRSPVTVPIPGTSNLAHMRDNAAAASLILSPDDIAELDN